MVSPDAPHRDDIDELNADLARRLGKPATATHAVPQPATSSPPPPPVASQDLSPPTPPAAPPHTRRAWLPIAAAATVCLALGLGAGWLLFGRDSDAEPVTIADEPAETLLEQEAPASANEPDQSVTLEDLFEQLPFEQVQPGESPLDDLPFGELPLDDFISPDDLAELESIFENMPTADELNELFGDLEGEGLNEFLDPDSIDQMNEIFEELFGE